MCSIITEYNRKIDECICGEYIRIFSLKQHRDLLESNNEHINDNIKKHNSNLLFLYDLKYEINNLTNVDCKSFLLLQILLIILLNKFYKDKPCEEYKFKFLKEKLDIYNKKILDIINELKEKYNFEKDDSIELDCILKS